MLLAILIALKGDTLKSNLQTESFMPTKKTKQTH